MANVGYGTLTIIPSARGFRRRLQDEVSGDIDQVGRSSGEDFGSSFRRAVTPHVDETGRRIRREVGGATDDTRGRLRRFTSAVGTSFANLGDELGRFSLRFTRFGFAIAALGPVVLTVLAAISGAIVAIGTAAVTAAGTIAGAFAGIGIGAALFAQTARGEAALTRFKTRATAILTDAAAPLLDSFNRALPQITSLLNRLRPVFRDVFGTLSGVVDRGVIRAVTAFQQLAPAIGTVTQAASAFFDGFSSTFGLIARRLTPALQELAPMLQVVASQLGEQLGGALSRLLPQLVRLGERALPVLPGVLKLVTGALGTLINLGNIVIDVWTGLVIGALRLRTALLQLNVEILRAQNALPGVNRESQIAAVRTRVMASQADTAAAKNFLLSESSSRLSGSLGTQRDRTNAARRALENYSETILGALEGQIAYRRQLDRTGEELRQGAASFNLNTQEGRENADAVVSQVQEARNQIQTYNEQGRTTDFIRGKTQQFTQELLQEAQQAGFTTGQIEDLISSSDSIPRSIRQEINSNADSAEELVRGLIGALDSIPPVVSTRVDVAVTGTPLDQLQNLAGRQHGGPVRRMQPYVVGESGPELFVPNQSGTVVPNNELPDRGGDGGALIGGDVNLTVPQGSTPREMVDELTFDLRRRRRGGVLSSG